MSPFLLFGIIFLGITQLVFSDDVYHEYTAGEIVTLWVNTVGPYHNPQETYPYYQLPFCKPDFGIETKKRPSGVGEILEGNELRNSGLKLHFHDDIANEDVCDLLVTAENALEFTKAVQNQYWYELYLDDLPMWGMVGETLRDDKGQMATHIFTHRSLSLSYNGDRIIEANLTSENPVSLDIGSTLAFTYSVKWVSTTKSFVSRFDRYLESDFFEHQIHWFSIFNSFMMVMFLCGLVSLILLRTLRNDFARYSKEDMELDVEGSHTIGEDSGWKQVHGDVFRAPEYLTLFSALWGTGWQLVMLVLAVVLFAMAGSMHGQMYEDRGKIATTVIVFFALSSAIGGFASGSYYRQYFKSPRAELTSQWQQTLIVTSLLLPTVVCLVIAALNTIAIYYDTVNAIPFVVIIKMVALWTFVAFPLSIGGTIFGRHFVTKSDPPCRVNSIPRPIPACNWYCSPYFIIPASGILPFGSIFIEMYFIFTSFWSYKFYYVYGFMLLVYGILTMVTICTTIVGVYFCLNAENYHWQWISFLSSGSTAGYVFLYSLYYFFEKTQMTGLLQIAFYFGYMFLFSFVLFLMCGSIGVWGVSIFVHKIYGNVKID